jgi:hypothetical protein
MEENFAGLVIFVVFLWYLVRTIAYVAIIAVSIQFLGIWDVKTLIGSPWNSDPVAQVSSEK